VDYRGSFAVPDPTEAKTRKELIDPAPERLRAQQREAEHLFETLLERAFRGEV
jgi:hypothetical protein